MLEWKIVPRRRKGLGMKVEGNEPGTSGLQVGRVRSHAPPCVPQPPLGEIVYHFPSTGQPPLVLLDKLSFVMDRLFLVPGTRLRIGLNSILLLVPVVGDIIPSLASVLILVIGLKNYRVPRIVAARMVLNTGLDAALGWIPIFGDLFNLFFKADTRNVRLLQEYAGRGELGPHAVLQHWVFVVGVLLFFALICVGLALGTFILVRSMNHTINQMFGGH
jgi:hypothetical protein